MVLVETYPGETLDEFRATINEILTNVWDPPMQNWWHPYEIHFIFRIRGMIFRDFDCVAGSVTGQLVVQGMRGRIQRRLAFIQREDSGYPSSILQLGVTCRIDPAEVERLDVP